MKTIFNFGEIGNFDLGTEENVKYIASYLGWVEFIEKTIQVNLPDELVVDQEGNPVLDDDGNEQFLTPTRPETIMEENSILPEDYIVVKAKEILADIPKKAYMVRNEETLANMKAQMEAELKTQIEGSIS